MSAHPANRTRPWLHIGLWFLLLLGISSSTFAEEESAKESKEVDEIQAVLGKVQRPEKMKMPTGFIQLDETVISGNQELPKVLYILPWRQPTGLPDIELKADFAEMDIFRRLYPPAYRRELSYFETLDGKNSEE